MVRHFFHLTPIGPTPDTWEQEAEGRHLFRLTGFRLRQG